MSACCSLNSSLRPGNSLRAKWGLSAANERQRKIFPPMRNTTLSSPKGMSSVTPCSDKAKARMSSMFVSMDGVCCFSLYESSLVAAFRNYSHYSCTVVTVVQSLQLYSYCWFVSRTPVGSHDRFGEHEQQGVDMNIRIRWWP